MGCATVTKGEFARLINVSPGRVSQYISEGKLHGPALVGEGRMARIAVDIAAKQLNNSLDISQRLGNGIDTRLPLGDEAAPVVPALPVDVAARTLEDQIKVEKLEGLRRQRRREEEEDRARAGLYTRTEDVTASTRRLVGLLLDGVEGGLAGMAQSIAARFQVPQRDVLHLLRQEFRGVRTDIARRSRALAADLPEVTDDPLDGEDEDEA